MREFLRSDTPINIYLLTIALPCMLYWLYAFFAISRLFLVAYPGQQEDLQRLRGGLLVSKERQVLMWLRLSDSSEDPLRRAVHRYYRVWRSIKFVPYPPILFLALRLILV